MSVLYNANFLFSKINAMSKVHKNHPPIPKRLKEARIAAKLSQRKLGIMAGIYETSASARLNGYEQGRHIPDHITLKRIADALSMPCAYFYADNDDLAQAIKIFSMLDADKKLETLEFIKASAEKDKYK